ncbi:DUF1642 domain-containing protein [Listeria sp. FSL L7-1582]|uniref:DUF1642 domain-containing protein n=1 Tax=Listeria portnoyi TaxID=2713504 RepID=UPI00164E5A93|nr:DUF1642 domain-containing protein [Listeria portnoyi]MBC6308147.1 DUF1642 domain-containing protein [Listeria portnoyi]
MTQKFKVGDRVQVIAESRLLTNKILEIDEDGEMYRVGTIGDNRWIHIYNLAPAPALVVVPQCVSQFLNLYKDKNTWSLTELFDYLFTAREPLEKEVYEWIQAKNGNDELFARAWLEGYTVEKEPLYMVEFPSLAYPTYLVKSDDGILAWQNTDNGTRFTKPEIKAIDERYWQFSVPVEVSE